MASRHLFLFLFGVLVLSASHSQAAAYSCELDSSSSYQPPACGSSSSSSSYIAAEQQQHRHLLQSESATPPRPGPNPPKPEKCASQPSKQLLKCCLKFEYVFGEYISKSVYGYGLNEMDSSIQTGDIQGGHQVLLTHTYDLMDSIARMSRGNIKAIGQTVGNSSGPDIDLRENTFSDMFNNAVGFSVWPGFNPYESEKNFLVGSYWFIGFLTKCYLGIIDQMEGPYGKRLVGALAAAKGEQEAVIRAVMYQMMNQQVEPYHMSISDAATSISQYRDRLLNASGTSDEGFYVPPCDGGGGQSKNLFSADSYELPYSMKVGPSCKVATEALNGFLK